MSTRYPASWCATGMGRDSRSVCVGGLAPDRRLRITQVNTADVGGGAERIAWNLHRAYLARGHHSRLVVGLRRSSAPEVVALPNDAFRSGWARAWARVSAPLEPLAGRG